MESYTSFRKTILAIIVSFIAILGCATFAVNASAEETTTFSASNVIAEGECGAGGDNLIWQITDDYTLYITGTGQMADYDYSPSMPWSSYSSSIVAVNIGEGVTSIGDYAFNGCSAIKNITIPNSITDVGYDLFKGSSNVPRNGNLSRNLRGWWYTRRSCS